MPDTRLESASLGLTDSGRLLSGSLFFAQAMLTSANTACAIVMPSALHFFRIVAVTRGSYVTVSTCVRRSTPGGAFGNVWPPW